MTKDDRGIGGWAHDFRNVVASLLSYADLYAVSACSKEQLLDGLRANCGWFLELVDGLVDEIDGPEGTPASLTTIPLRVLVDNVVDTHRLALQAKSIRLTVDIERELIPLAPAQAIIVKRILVNLLSNAIRHSQSKEIVVRVAQVATSQRGGDGWYCLLEVQDFGKGIPRQQLKRIMQGSSPNPSAPPSKRRRGLATTQALVATLGGKLMVQSQFGKGTRCSVEFSPGPLPAYPVGDNDDDAPEIVRLSDQLTQRPTSTKGREAKAQTELAADKPSLRKPSPTSRSVLLIDDDAELRSLISAVLLAEGIRTIAVADEARALDCRLSDIDCVLLDLNLENARGCDVAKRLRHAGFARPILALTAEPVKRVRDASGHMSMEPFDGWIDKTLGGGAVATRLRQLLSSVDNNS
jgi:CheY-like chemotaxis protein/two-component sensor histidine kinase